MTSTTAYSYGILFRLDVTRADGQRVRNTEISFFDDFSAQPGSRILMTADVSVYRASLADGISLNADDVQIVGIEEGRSIRARLIRLRESIVRCIAGYLGGEEGALCTALVAGDRSGLSTGTRIAFSRAGISHILAVSGLHVSVFLGLLTLLLRRLRAPTWVTALLLFGMAGLLAAFYGFTPSVIRACVMAVIVFGGSALMRPEDAVTTLGFAALVVLLPSPQAVVGASFVLSFGSIAAIRLIYPPVSDWLVEHIGWETLARRIALTLTQALSLTVIVNLAILPALALFGMDFPLAAIVVSPFAVAVVGVLMPLTLVLLAVSFFPPLGAVIALFCGVLAKAVIAVATAVAAIPAASVSLGAPYFWVCLAGAAVIVALFAAAKGRVSLRLACGCCALLFVCGILSSVFALSGKTTVTVYGGDAAVVTRDRKSVAVVFGYKANDLLYLREYLLSHITEMPEYVIIAGTSAELAARRVADAFPESRVMLWDEVVEQVFPVFELTAQLLHRDVLVLADAEGTSLAVVRQKTPDGIDLEGYNTVARFADDGFYIETRDGAVFYDGSSAVRFLLSDGSARKVGE